MKKKVEDTSWPVNCANCGKQTFVDGTPGEKCIWCSKSPYKKEASPMVSQDERAKYEAMNMQERNKWLYSHMEEIIADIRSMPKKKVFEKWPFSPSKFLKIIRIYAPELIRKPRKNREVIKGEKPPATGKEVSTLTKHEHYLILLGYQMATREFLDARES